LVEINIFILLLQGTGNALICIPCVFLYNICMTKIIKDLKDFEGIVVDDIVCVVTYKRQKFIDKWLRAWNNANKCNCKLFVFHSIDSNHNSLEEEKENILKYNPDFYIQFENSSLMDLKALIYACGEMLHLLKWKKMFWFSDDMLPMRKNFLVPFIEKFFNPKVGLVAQCYEPKTPHREGGHIRTVAYGITSEVARKLTFPKEGELQIGTRPAWSATNPFRLTAREIFEHGDNHILEQVRKMGHDVQLTHSKIDSLNYVHWTSFLDWMWDCHLLGEWKQYWDVYEDQFKSIEKLDVESDPYTILTEYECEKITKVPNKMTAIIPTYNCDINTFMRCIFSLLLRTTPETLEHFIVGINGGDDRDKNNPPELQDKKQKFLEELRSLNWVDINGAWDKPMPITISRTWSRVGHSQIIEQCISWVHTEYYLLMHDDVIVLSRDWESQLKSFFSNKNAIMKTAAPLSAVGVLAYPKSEDQLRMPHVTSTDFLLCSLPLMKRIKANWVGYHVDIEKRFKIDNFTSSSAFLEYWRGKRLLEHEQNSLYKDVYDPNNEFRLLSLDVGAFILPKILNSDYVVEMFDPNTRRHYGARSWCKKNENTKDKDALELEEELEKYPEYNDLYNKYKDEKENCSKLAKELVIQKPFKTYI
jgi:hypothetical protein